MTKQFIENKLGNKILSLPISEEHSKKEIYFVIKTIKNFLFPSFINNSTRLTLSSTDCIMRGS